MKLSATVYYTIDGRACQDVVIDGGPLKTSLTHDVSTKHLIYALALNHRMRQKLIGHSDIKEPKA